MVPPERSSNPARSGLQDPRRKPGAPARVSAPAEAPRKVLEAQYGERIEADVAQELIQTQLPGRDINCPRVSCSPSASPASTESGAIRDARWVSSFIITVDVRPDIELQSTGPNLDVVYPKVEIPEDDDRSRRSARPASRATLKPRGDQGSRPASCGDMALVALTVTDDEGQEVANEMGTMIRTEGDPYYPGVEDLRRRPRGRRTRSQRVPRSPSARTLGSRGWRGGPCRPPPRSWCPCRAYRVPEAQTTRSPRTLGYEGGVRPACGHGHQVRSCVDQPRGAGPQPGPGQPPRGR